MSGFEVALVAASALATVSLVAAVIIVLAGSTARPHYVRVRTAIPDGTDPSVPRTVSQPSPDPLAVVPVAPLNAEPVDTRDGSGPQALRDVVDGRTVRGAEASS